MNTPNYTALVTGDTGIIGRHLRSACKKHSDWTSDGLSRGSGGATVDTSNQLTAGLMVAEQIEQALQSVRSIAFS